MFKRVLPKVDLPKLEEEVLSFWKEQNIFEKSVTNRPEDKRWTFLDGPPFVTGLPHYGHLLTSIAKDIYPRFWTMKGYRVERVWGWDGHGLPVENKVENKLAIKRKKDIEEIIGIKKFIDECKKYVNQVSEEWEWYIDHIGRWVDFKHAYKTWNIPYMESVMWVFKQMYEKNLIYKGLRVSLYCPHCATPISNFEVAMDADNYKEIIDPATTYKYQLVEELNTYILAWSTTPWNKIVTPALAVNPDLVYVKVQQTDEKYILAKTTLNMLEGEYKIIDEFKGMTLIGKKYVPHYNYYPVEKGEKVFEIIGGNFVTADEGTGVVTIAAYGEEDLQVMQKNNVHVEMHLDEEGMIKPDVPLFGGMYYLKANKLVNEDLSKRGLIYKDIEYPHNIPLCWRCHTRLYYAPQNAWFVNVQSLKEEMKKTNEKVNWYPTHFKHGRFLKSLENAPDWNISRNRYWGSPVPVWECHECDNRFVPGSLKELEVSSRQKITDLHRPEIDDVTVPCNKCKKPMYRVPEVLDSWIEAGSASFAERHFPFNSEAKLENFFPPDFIVEYTGQIRAWFYVVHVIANALYKSRGFENVLVNGVILGTDGRKMSKNFGNYPDPRELITKYGGDALRLYLASSPVIEGEDMVISEEHYRNQVKGLLLILWNTYNFFVTYANIDKFTVQMHKEKVSENVLDKWVLSILHRLIGDVTNSLNSYDSVSAITAVQKFVNDFSTWYIRRSRDRVGPSADNKEDKRAFFSTCFEVLTTLCKLIAPLTPFIAEEIYRNLTTEESVHLTNWPEADKKMINEELEKHMQCGHDVASLILMQRKTHGVKVRTPLKKVTYEGPEELDEAIKKIVSEEVNVYALEYGGKNASFSVDGAVDQMTNPENQDLLAGQARDIIRFIQEERKKLGTEIDEMVDVTIEAYPEAFEGIIKKHALVRSLARGDSFSITRLS